MKISLNLLESDSQIKKLMLDALVGEVDKYMVRSISVVKRALPSIMSGLISRSPEYQSLENGRLRLELGIDNSSVKLAKLITVWSTNIEYKYERPTVSAGQVKTKFSAQLIRADFSDVLYTDFAAVVDLARGYTLPWLEWLLLEGNKILVPNHSVVIGPNRGSRTGYAVMREGRGSWKVPSEFSGTFRDNWITRAIDKGMGDVESLLDRAFQ